MATLWIMALSFYSTAKFSVPFIFIWSESLIHPVNECIEIRSFWNCACVRGCNERKEKLQYKRSLSLWLTQDGSVVFFPELNIVGCFDSAASKHVKQDKCIQPNPWKHGLHLYALAGRRASAPEGDPKLEETRWCCTGFVVISTVVTRDWGHWFYMLSEVWQFLPFP